MNKGTKENIKKNVEMLKESLKLPGFHKCEIEYQFKYGECKAMMFFCFKKSTGKWKGW